MSRTLEREPATLPPIPEQAAIAGAADALDRADGQIIAHWLRRVQGITGAHHPELDYRQLLDNASALVKAMGGRCGRSRPGSGRRPGRTLPGNTPRPAWSRACRWAI